jgi:hypothetical protein
MTIRRAITADSAGIERRNGMRRPHGAGTGQDVSAVEGVALAVEPAEEHGHGAGVVAQ